MSSIPILVSFKFAARFLYQHSLDEVAARRRGAAGGSL
jgi:hypothetical protein